jgi:hypothetical protein
VSESDVAFEWSRRLWYPLSRSPRLFPWMVRAQRRPNHHSADPDDQIVIDGFPRSANTFSSRAFSFVNPGVRMSHHMHAPANILLAVRHGVPAIVVIRRPADAVLSEVIREPRKRLKRALAEWVSYYSLVKHVVDHVVIADFAVVTTDYAFVIAEVNCRFGTSFNLYHNSPESDQAVFDSIESTNRARGRTGMRLETRVPRPSAERLPRKAALQPELARPELLRLLERAEFLYEELLAVAPHPS